MSHSMPPSWEYDLCGPYIPAEPTSAVYEQGQAAMRVAHDHQDAGRPAEAADQFLCAAADAERLYRLAKRYGDQHRAEAWRAVSELRKGWSERERRLAEPRQLCEMTVTGCECGRPAWGGLGVVHPVTDRYTTVLLTCKNCACVAMDSTEHTFKVLDLDVSHRIRARQ